MSRDYAKLERELIEDLARTGKDLAQWMAAIDGAALGGRNAIIDWLRTQGFSFSRASWLERIHHNGGRPVYTRADGHNTERPRPPIREEVVPPVRPAAKTRPPAAVAAPAAPDELAAVLARGKAFRPLAEMLLQEIQGALPGAMATVAGDLVLIGRPSAFAALLITARELRLGLDLGDLAFDDDLVKPNLPKAAGRVSHMVVLRDARQVGPRLMGLISAADARANPSPS